LDVIGSVPPPHDPRRELERFTAAGRRVPLDARLLHHHVDGILAEQVGDPPVQRLVHVHEVVGVEDDALDVTLVVPDPDAYAVSPAMIVVRQRLSIEECDDPWPRSGGPDLEWPRSAGTEQKGRV